MKVRLLRRARIWHNAGETVKVSPAEGAFLLSVGSAAPIKEKKAKAPEKEEEIEAAAEETPGAAAEETPGAAAEETPGAAAEEDGGTDYHTSVRAGSQ